MRLRRLNVQGCDPQIPVVAQGDLDQRLEARISEEVPPSDRVGGRFAGATQFFDLETYGDIARIGFHYRFGDRGEPVPPSPILGHP